MKGFVAGLITGIPYASAIRMAVAVPPTTRPLGVQHVTASTGSGCWVGTQHDGHVAGVQRPRIAIAPVPGWMIRRRNRFQCGRGVDGPVDRDCAAGPSPKFVSALSRRLVL